MIFLQFHAIAASRGDGLRPELEALFNRLAMRPSEAVTREDGLIQSGSGSHTEPLHADTARPMLAVCAK
jgi:hypothetical protein